MLQIHNTVLTGADIIAMSVPAFNGDLDSDGQINANEFTLVANEWKQTGSENFILGDNIAVPGSEDNQSRRTYILLHI